MAYALNAAAQLCVYCTEGWRGEGDEVGEEERSDGVYLFMPNDGNRKATHCAAEHQLLLA